MKVKVYRVSVQWTVDVPESEDVNEASKIAQHRISTGEVVPDEKLDTQFLFAPITAQTQKSASQTATLAKHLIALDPGDRNVIVQRLGLKITADPSGTASVIAQILSQTAERELGAQLVEEVRKRQRHHERVSSYPDLIEQIREQGKKTPVSDLLRVSQLMGLHTDNELRELVNMFDNIVIPEDGIASLPEIILDHKRHAIQTMIGRATEHEEDVLPRLFERLVLAQEDKGSVSPERRVNEQSADVQDG